MTFKTFSAWGRSWGSAWGNAWGNERERDYHDGGDYYIKWWKKQHEKKPTAEQIIELIKDNPLAAIRAVPETKERYPEIDQERIKNDIIVQKFLARGISLLIDIQARKQQLEQEDEYVIEMLLFS